MHEPQEIKFVSFVSKMETSDNLLVNKQNSTTSLIQSQQRKFHFNYSNPGAFVFNTALIIVKHETGSNDFKCTSCTIEESGSCEHCKDLESKKDVFHLTFGNEDITTTATDNVSNSTGQIGLKEILISNFDRKFANSIGIDFVPMQVMSTQDLRFIPFEKIDSSYRK